MKIIAGIILVVLGTILVAFFGLLIFWIGITNIFHINIALFNSPPLHMDSTSAIFSLLLGTILFIASLTLLTDIIKTLAKTFISYFFKKRRSA